MITTCVLFNHPYPKNIPFLRDLMAPRFRDLVFAQPLVRSHEPDVYTTYRGSYSFHGQIPDVLDRLLSRPSEVYIFVQDDVLLNPRFNDVALVDRLGVGAGDAFIPEIAVLGGELSWWPWTLRTVWQAFYPMNPLSGSGVENLAGLLPDPATLQRHLETKYQLQFHPVRYSREDDFSSIEPFKDPGLKQAAVRVLIDGLFSSSVNKGEIDLPFPYCRAMSDFFIVHRSVLPRVAEMLGWFAAADIFAEVAVPTALLACADRVIQAQDVGVRAEWRWGSDRNHIEAVDIVAGFKNDLLLVHPLKLSRDRELVESVIEELND